MGVELSEIRLPVDAAREEIVGRFREFGRLVVEAPPGSGKSTRVPRFLRDALGSGLGVVVLQPRRIAARMLAERVASELGESVGETVGYEVRFDRRVGRDTRIRFLTEGVFLRQLVGGDGLKGVGAVVLDEFHERHLEADLILGRLREIVAENPSRVGICIMSATLNAATVSEMIGGAPIVSIPGSLHPVETRLVAARSGGQGRGRQSGEPIWDHAARVVGERFRAGVEGSVLVFMPGAGEIRRTIEACRREKGLSGVEVLPLYGELPPAEQDRAVAAVDRARVIVATNIAEASLTIPGVRHVVDSGLVREKNFDPGRRINFLDTKRVSRASADQRRGRAGRLGPGTCDRLWSERDEATMEEAARPEIVRLDLADIFLRVRAFGTEDPRQFAWPEVPEEARAEEAEKVLHLLRMVERPFGPLTGLGKLGLDLPLHPRLAAMVLSAGKDPGLRSATINAAVLLQERPIVRPTRDKHTMEERAESDPFGGISDLLLEGHWLDQLERKAIGRGDIEVLGLAAGAMHEALRARRQLADVLGWRLVPLDGSGPEVPRLGRCLLAGFPDLVAKRRVRGGASFDLAAGMVGRLDGETVVRPEEWVLAATLRSVRLSGVPTVLLSRLTKVEPEWLEELFPEHLSRIETLLENDSNGSLEAVEEVRFLELAVSRKTLGTASAELRGRFFGGLVRRGEKQLKHWNDEVEAFIRRVNFAAVEAPELEIDRIDDDARTVLLESICEGVKRNRDLRMVEVMPVVRSWLSREQLIAVEQMIPETYGLAQRKKPAEIRYTDDGRAILAATIQELWEEKEPPSILNGRYPLYLEILAPNRRPIQITRDLEGFWKGSYAAVRKELAGRYPKHKWP